MATILLWNARGVRSKKAELLNNITSYDIVVITETKAGKDEVLYYPGYKVYKSDNGNNAGGVAILIRNNIDFEVIKNVKVNSVNFYVIGIKILNTTREYNLIAVYRKPYGYEKKLTWEELLDF